MSEEIVWFRVLIVRAWWGWERVPWYFPSLILPLLFVLLRATLKTNSQTRHRDWVKFRLLFRSHRPWSRWHRLWNFSASVHVLLPEMKFSCVVNVTPDVIYGSVCQRLSAPSTFSVTRHPLKCGPCIIPALSRTIYHDDEEDEQDIRHLCCIDR